MVGPFILLDKIGPEQLAPGAGLDIDAHPHIGLATLSYLFDGRLVHRDSTGAVQVIEPGAVNWMSAGAGVTHTERTHPDDRGVNSNLEGVQIWVALPDDVADGLPSFVHLDPTQIPNDVSRGASIRVVAGSGYGLESSLPVASPMLLADVELDGTHHLAVDRTHPEVAVGVVGGVVELDGRTLEAGMLAILPSGHRSRISGTGRALVIGGDPVGPRHIWWNFVHRDADRIEEAKRDWSAQRFPLVPHDHEPWVPLPS